MNTIYIDNRPYAVRGGQNLLQACLTLGFDIPYFCWHPALHSIGACRQCAVKLYRNEQDTRGRIVMSCMTPAAHGVRLSIDDEEAREFRARMIEFLMVNHPHDCPVCDEGGECHLQDMTVMTGHCRRRYRFGKRTHRNQDLGPFVAHEMNRCIACYRCVRFYRDYAQGADFGVFGWHHEVYFGRAADGVLESEFSGNLVEVCPTGVFTDKTLQAHYTRKWDLQTAPSLCPHCGLGCNTTPGERDGLLRRIRNRYHPDVNGYFLCDRGRYGYEFVNAAGRVRQPLLRRRDGGAPHVATADEALARAAELVRDPARVIGIGSPRASLEANFALRALVGPERFFAGVSARDNVCALTAVDALVHGAARSPSLREVESADAVLVLGEDVANTAPLLALALRQAVRQEGLDLAAGLGIPAWHDAAVRDAAQSARSPLFLAMPCATRLDDAAAEVYRAAPEDLARLGFAVAHAIHAQAPGVEGMEDAATQLAIRIAKTLKTAERPLVVTGFGCGSQELMHAAAHVAWALQAAGCDVSLFITAPECNSMGLAMLGAGALDEAVRLAQAGAVDTMVVLENDLYRRLPVGQAAALLASVPHCLVLEHSTTRTTQAADVLLPAATYAESDGTLVNCEGRAQRHYKVFPASGDVRESWRWLRDLIQAAGRTEAAGWHTFSDLLAAVAQSHPRWAALSELAPPAGAPIAGLQIPRQPHRWSGRTALYAHRDVHEPRPPADRDSPLAFSMEGFQGQPPGPLFPREWAPGWNSTQAITKFQEEVYGALRGGNPGRRLIEPRPGAAAPYYPASPPAPAPRAGAWRVVPLHHVFGSDELSVLAPGIAARTPAPYAALSPDDAAALGVRAGEAVDVDGRQLPALIDPSLPRGVVGLPANLPGFGSIPATDFVEVRKGGAP